MEKILIKKFGTKKLICAGFCSLIASMLIYSFAQTLAWFYVGGAVAAKVVTPIIYDSNGSR